MKPTVYPVHHYRMKGTDYRMKGTDYRMKGTLLFGRPLYRLREVGQNLLITIITLSVVDRVPRHHYTDQQRQESYLPYKESGKAMTILCCEKCNSPMIVVERKVCRNNNVWYQCSKNKRHPVRWGMMVLGRNENGTILNRNAYQYGHVAQTN